MVHGGKRRGLPGIPSGLVKLHSPSVRHHRRLRHSDRSSQSKPRDFTSTGRSLSLAEAGTDELVDPKFEGGGVGEVLVASGHQSV